MNYMLLVGTVASALFGAGATLPHYSNTQDTITTHQPSPVTHVQEAPHSQSAEEIYNHFISQQTESALPIAQVEMHKALNTVAANGTVIFIPQSHIKPGTSALDSTNDAAVKTQAEIAQIVAEAADEQFATTTFIEGQARGAVSSTMLSSAQEKARAYSTTTTAVHEMHSQLVANGNTEEAAQLQEAHKTLGSQVERELLLAGAPMALYANGTPLELYGTERPETLAASAAALRDTMYIQDQLQQVAKAGSSPAARLVQRDSGDSLDVKKLYKLMKQQQSTGASGTSNASHVSIEKEINEAAAVLQMSSTKTTQLQQTVDRVQQPLFIEDPLQGTSAPARSANPYASIHNQTQLEQMLTQSQENMKAIVLEQRNVETADAVATQMASSDSRVSILEYGIGHTDGLIKELQKQQLDVVVIVPASIGYKR